MAVSVNTIPSVSIPFTDAQGRISPIWHEFLRSFVTASVDGTVSEESAATTVAAGNGLTGGGVGEVTLTVGQGYGIAVNADDVSVDITNQASVQAALDDEVMIADTSDSNTIRKTTVRDIAALGGVPAGNNSQVQYNNGGIFGGHSGFTYNGAGSFTLNNTFTASGTTFTASGNALTTPFTFYVNGGSAAAHYVFTQATSGSNMPFEIASHSSATYLYLNNDKTGSGSTTSESAIQFQRIGSTKWTLGLTGSSSGSVFTLGTSGTNTGNAFTVDATNMNFSVNTSLLKSTTAGITASTTQTQGQQALTTDVNEISVCAVANDVVTLPAALAGRQCLVINNGAETLQVFPASGDNLGAGVNTSTTIVSTSRKLFVAYDGTNWEPVI